MLECLSSAASMHIAPIFRCLKVQLEKRNYGHDWNDQSDIRRKALGREREYDQRIIGVKKTEQNCKTQG